MNNTIVWLISLSIILLALSGMMQRYDINKLEQSVIEIQEAMKDE